MGEKYRPIPWPVLDYDSSKGGYIVPMAKAELEDAPAYRMEDLTAGDAQSSIRTETFNYYHAPHYW